MVWGYPSWKQNSKILEQPLTALSTVQHSTISTKIVSNSVYYRWCCCSYDSTIPKIILQPVYIPTQPIMLPSEKNNSRFYSFPDSVDVRKKSDERIQNKNIKKFLSRIQNFFSLLRTDDDSKHNIIIVIFAAVFLRFLGCL